MKGAALLSQQETEIVWLTHAIKHEQDLIRRAEEYFRENQYNWSREVADYFFRMLEQMKDQLYFKEHRFERLAWQIAEHREGLRRP